MIQPQELRIGNMVMYEGKVHPVVALAANDIVVSVHGGMGSSYTPIPLTEEWLMKAGFVKVPFETRTGIDDDAYYYELGKFILSHNFTLCDIDITVQPKYLHQLQNLYFALTGEELKIEI